MSVVEFKSKKGTGKKVSTDAAKVAADPDWVEPEEDDDEAPKGKRKRQQMDEDSQEASPPKKTARGRPVRGSKSKDRAEGATAVATGESSGANEAEGGGSANEDEAEPARPTKSRKAGKAGRAAASSAGTKADGAGAAPATSSRKQSKRAAQQAEEEEDSFDSDEYEEEDNGGRSAGGRGGGGEAVEGSGRKGEASASTAGRRKFARRFQKDLPQMLYGFGDVRTPLPQTVQLMEDLVVDYVTQVLRKASGAAEARQRATRGSSTSRVKEADLLFVLRKDRKRLHRVLELLEVFEEQKQARADENPDDMAKSYDKDA